MARYRSPDAAKRNPGLPWIPALRACIQATGLYLGGTSSRFLRAAYLLLLLVPALSAVNAQTIRGSGIPKTETRTLESFDRIDASGAFEITLVPASVIRVTVTADDNLVDAVDTIVGDGVLRIGSLRSFVSRTQMQVKVEAPAVREVALTGSGTLTALSLSGKEFAFSGGGSTAATFGGRVDVLNLSIAGSARVDALELAGDRVDVKVIGSGHAAVNPLRVLEVSIIGSGVVHYVGEPKLYRSVIGKGKIEKITK